MRRWSWRQRRARESAENGPVRAERLKQLRALLEAAERAQCLLQNRVAMRSLAAEGDWRRAKSWYCEILDMLEFQMIGVRDFAYANRSFTEPGYY